MNIYNFVNPTKQKKIKKEFLNNIKLKYNTINYSKDFDKKILETIELFLKKDIYHLIEYEKKIAFEANIIKSSEEFINSLSNSQEWQNYFFKEYDIKNYFDIQLKKIFLLIEEILTCLSNDILLLNLKDKVLK